MKIRFILNNLNLLRYLLRHHNESLLSAAGGIFARHRLHFCVTQLFYHTQSLYRYVSQRLICSSSLLSLPVVHCWKITSDDFSLDRKLDDLFYASRNNDAVRIERLVKSGVDPNQRHSLGWTPLQIAAFHGNYNAVKALIEHGADVNAGDEFTSMNDILQKHNGFQFLEILLLRESDFSPRLRANSNYKGCTALHYAVLGNFADVVQLLIENGADPSIKNEANHSPIDYAKDQQMAEILKQYSSQFEKLKSEKEAEERRKFPLEERIKQHLIGQDGAITTVASCIRRKENGWYDEEHPLVFLFLGSSGIGKTELAKQVARYLHKDVSKCFIRLDMSEYQQKHEVAKFIGAPPGYVGYDEGGQLTSKLRQCPNAVVLFDEIEKAHPDILTIMLQLFDEGRLTDGQGKTIQCKDAIFIMTSNLASEKIADYGEKLREEARRVNLGKIQGTVDDVNINEKVAISRDFKERIIQPILKRHFRRDEFLGRINEMVYFLPFSKPELIQLVTKELEFWKKKAFEKHKIDLEWNRDVLDALADGYNIRYGARSIKHEVERRVVNKLALAHELQLIKEGAKVRIIKTVEEINKERESAIELEVIEKGHEKSKLLQIPLGGKLLEALKSFAA